MSATKNVIDVLTELRRSTSRAGFFSGSLIGPIVTLGVLTAAVNYALRWSIIIGFVWAFCVAIATLSTIRELLFARELRSEEWVEYCSAEDARTIFVLKIFELLVFLCALAGAIFLLVHNRL